MSPWTLFVTLNFINRVGNLKRDIKTRNKRFTLRFFFFSFFFFHDKSFAFLRRHANNLQFVWHYKRRKWIYAYFVMRFRLFTSNSNDKKKKKTRKKQSSFLWLKLRIFQSCLINQLWELDLKKRKNADAYNYNYFSYNNNSRSDRIWRKKKKNLHTTLHFYPVSSCCKQEKNLPKLLSVIWLI